MPEERPTAVYHLDFSRVRQPGQLIRLDDSPGGQADVYFHPLHIRAEVVQQLNQLGLHQIGHGLWRQRWAGSDRVNQAAEGLKVAESRWEIVPSREMPKRRHVVPIEEDGICVWHVKAGYCTSALVDEMNRIWERVVGDGLWVQYWSEEQPVSGLYPAPFMTPALSLACV